MSSLTLPRQGRLVRHKKFERLASGQFPSSSLRCTVMNVRVTDAIALQSPVCQVWRGPSWQRSTWQSGTEAGPEASAGLFPLWSTRQVGCQSLPGAPGGMLLHGWAWRASRLAALVQGVRHVLRGFMVVSGTQWGPAWLPAPSAPAACRAPLVCRSTIRRDGADWDQEGGRGPQEGQEGLDLHHRLL